MKTTQVVVRKPPLLDNVPLRHTIDLTICTLVRPVVQLWCARYFDINDQPSWCRVLTHGQLASLHTGAARSLTHPMPTGKNMYAPGGTAYPFPVIANFTDTVQLLELLPEREELFACLDVFQRHAQACSFPHMPDNVTKRGIERFLSDRERNAELCPEMLALIFATLATGLQMGKYDKDRGRWTEENTKDNREVYSTCNAFMFDYIS